MKPEELKIIAEGMGIEVHEYSNAHDSRGEYCIAIYHCNGTATIYNPIKNNNQMVKIIEKLKICISFSQLEDAVIAGVVVDDDYFDVKAKTINEAVCKAALEYFKEN